MGASIPPRPVWLQNGFDTHTSSILLLIIAVTQTHLVISYSRWPPATRRNCGDEVSLALGCVCGGVGDIFSIYSVKASRTFSYLVLDKVNRTMKHTQALNNN